jgi:hypothetical protein
MSSALIPASGLLNATQIKSSSLRLQIDLCFLVNKIQRAIILCSVLALIVTGLFPPWAAHLQIPEGGADITRPGGYHWIRSPPYFFTDSQQRFVSYYIDTTRLLTQWVLIVLWFSNSLLRSTNGRATTINRTASDYVIQHLP